MALPRPPRPEYSTTIPSTGKRIKYNPFSVKEEKILVLAAESNDPDEITNAVLNILQSCISSPSDVRVDQMALFDIEYLFLKARSKSVGEHINLNVTDPSDDTFVTEHSINIDRIGIDRTEGHSDIISIDEDMKIKMRYPGIEFFTEGINLSNITESIVTMTRCIDSIITEDEVYERVDMNTEELTEFLESLTTEQFRKITDFFVSMPRLRHSFTLKNTNTNKDFTIVLEGLSDFF